jgi:hypothetical protein
MLATGANAGVSLTVTPSGSYQGTIALSCNSTLAGVTCGFNPASLTLDGSNKAVTGTVTITAPSSIAALQPASGQHTRDLAHATLCWLPAGIFLLLTGATRKRFVRRARLQGFLILFGLCAVAAAFTACGSGGGGGTTMPQSETGTLTVTAAGSTGNVSQTAQITITVN